MMKQLLKKWEEEHGEATAHGIAILDENKHIAGYVPYSEESKKAMDRGGTFYKTPDGSYSSTPVASMSFDDKTGKIKFSVSEPIVKSDWFKSNFTNNDTFKAIASAYKMDPTGETSIKYTNKDGKEESRTIKDFLNDYQKTLKEFSDNYKDILNAKETAKSTTKSGIDISDSDAIIYLHSTSKDKNRYDNNTPVYLPDFAFSYFDFSKLGSYNSDDKTISAKDFYDWYNLDDGTPGKDELITKLTDAAAGSLVGWQQWGGKSEADTEDFDESAAGNQYARTMSFYRTLTNDNPDANVLTSTRLFVSSAVNSLVDNLYSATGNVMNFMGDFINSLDTLDDIITPLKMATAPIKGLASGYKMAADALYLTGAAADNVKIETKAELGEISLLGAIGNSIADGDINELLDLFEEQAGIKDKASFKSNRDTAHAMLLEAHNDMARLSSAATAGSIIGGVTAEVLKQIYLTNVIGAAASAPIGTITAGAELGGTYGRILFGSASVENIITGFKMISASLTAEQLSGAVKLASFSTNIIAQGLSDTILNDEEALHKMFTGEGATDAVQAFGMNTLFNGVGELSGLATTNGWAAIKATSAGQSIEAGMTRGLAKASSVKHKALAHVAEVMNKLTGNAEGAKIGGQKFNTAYHYQIAKASENISNAAKLAEKGETTVQATKRLVQDRVDLEVAYGRIARNRGRTVLDLQTNPRVAKYYQDTEIAAQKIINLEDGAGVKAGKKTLFTQETTDYIVRSNRIEYYIAKGGDDLKGLTKAEAADLAALQKRVEAYESVHSQEMIDAVSNYINKAKAYQYRFQNLLANDGVLDSKNLAEQRATGFWGEDGKNYIYTQALKEGETDMEAAKWAVDQASSGDNYRGKFEMDEYSYKPGDPDTHYLDPQLAFLSQQIAAAKVIDGRNWGDALLKTEIMAKQINIDGAPVTTSEIKKLRKNARDITDKVFKQYIANEDYKGYDFGKFYKMNEGVSERIAKKQESIDKLLKMDDQMATSIALDIDQEGIDILSRRLKLPEYGPVSTKAEFEKLFNNLSLSQQLSVGQATGIKNVTFRSYNAAIRNTDLSERLTRCYISENEKIMNSSTFKKYALEARTKQLTARQQTTLAKYQKELNELQKQANLVETGKDQFTLLVSGFTEDLVSVVSKSMQENKFFEQILKQYTDIGINKKQAIRYLALDNIKSSIGGKEFNEFFTRNLSHVDAAGDLRQTQKTRFFNAIKKAISSNTDSGAAL